MDNIDKEKIRHAFLCDDDPDKLMAVQNAVNRLLPGAETTCFRCANALLIRVRNDLDGIRANPGEYLVISDMNMPYTDKGEPDPEAGLHVLAMLDSWGLQCPAAIVSSGAWDDIKLKDVYAHAAGSVLYSPFSSLSDELGRLFRDAGA